MASEELIGSDSPRTPRTPRGVSFDVCRMLCCYMLLYVGLTGGVSPASNCFGSSVCQRQSAYHQKLVFRCGEMAVFKHAYDVSLT